jgi:chaperonin GroES
MAVSIRPLHDRVVVKRLEAGEEIRGGIIIPDTAKEKPQQAEVIAVGEGAVLTDGSKRPLDLKVGDIVLISKWGGNEVKIEDEEFLILKEDEILGIIEGAKRTKSATK